MTLLSSVIIESERFQKCKWQNCRYNVINGRTKAVYLFKVSFNRLQCLRPIRRKLYKTINLACL